MFFGIITVSIWWLVSKLSKRVYFEKEILKRKIIWGGRFYAKGKLEAKVRQNHGLRSVIKTDRKERKHGRHLRVIGGLGSRKSFFSKIALSVLKGVLRPLSNIFDGHCLISMSYRLKAINHFREKSSIIDVWQKLRPCKHQTYKMVKHTKTIRRLTGHELFECVWPFCGVGES